MTFETIASIIFAGFIIYGLTRIEMVFKELVYVLKTINANFVHYLDDRNKVKLSDETAARLEQISAQSFHDALPTDPQQAYNDGLADGSTALAQWVLGKEEKE